MHNFDFKKYLTENKLTSNSKLLSEILSGRGVSNMYLVVVRTLEQNYDNYSLGEIGKVTKVKIDIPLEDYLSEEARDELEYTGFQTNIKGTLGILYGYEVTGYYINTAAYPIQARKIEDLWKERDHESIADQLDLVVSDIEDVE